MVVHDLILLTSLACLHCVAACKMRPRVGALLSTSGLMNMSMFHVKRLSGVVVLIDHVSAVLMASISLETLSDTSLIECGSIHESMRA